MTRPREWTESESDTRAERIDPILAMAGWGQMTPGSMLRREVLAPGRILAGNKRAEAKTADYVLIHHSRPLAVLEAKKFGLGAAAGVAQAKDYADRLGVRFAYASDGEEWYAIDMDEGREGPLDPVQFPSPSALWLRTFGVAPTIGALPTKMALALQETTSTNDWRLRFGDVGFEAAGGKWEPRYYQRRAIDSVLDAVGAGQDRILLTLATGTGKTAIAFQIAWRLYKAGWNRSGKPGRRPRILFLADRNILASQAVNAFNAFPSDAIVRVEPKRIRKDGKVPMNGAIFFSIFQTLMTDQQGLEAADERGDLDDGLVVEAAEPNYRQYPPDFFDFIVIDECHRGGANDESSWRRIMEYFAPAVQLGLTATPKRDANVDTYKWFGEPVYQYALKTGIEDGYLTPFKVRQMASTMDDFVLRPGDTADGEIDSAHTYTETEINRIVSIPERELSRVREFMSAINQQQKTLVFCASQRHAGMVRDFINQVRSSRDPNYCVRVTADDGEIGDEFLRAFQDNEKTIPTILTTSHKLSTGVDARNVRNIVLMRPIRSIVEFKQIVGRGTRTYPGKDHFTILDFVKAYEHFQDPQWDGPPEEVLTPPEGGDKPPPKEGPVDEQPDDDPEGDSQRIVTVRLSAGRARDIRYIATTTYWFEGHQISAAEFLQRLFGDLESMVADEDQLRTLWSNPSTRKQFIERLEERGYDSERLEDMKRLVDAPDSDIFDVLAYVRFELAPLTRHERADRVRTTTLGEYEPEMREFLSGVLGSYEKAGVSELDPEYLGNILRVRYGGIPDALRRLGQVDQVRDAFVAIQADLYRP